MVHADAIGRALLPSLYGLPYGGIMITAISTRDEVDIGEEVVRTALSICDEWKRACLSSTPFWAAQLVQMEQEIADPWLWPCAPTACHSQWGWCDYLPLCERGAVSLREFIQARDEVDDTVDSAGE